MAGAAIVDLLRPIGVDVRITNAMICEEEWQVGITDEEFPDEPTRFY
jgi:hypothetical protein